MVSRRAAWLALAGVAGVALAFRWIGFERVLLPDGDVVLSFADATYHLRRAGWILHDFPRIPFFDPYLNHPDGAWIPYPPLYHFLVAFAAWIGGGDPQTLARIAAISPTLLGSLAVVPLYALGVRLGGRRLALGAAALYAVLPLPVRYSEIGNFDHHAAVAPLGTALIALYAAVLGGDAHGRRLLVLHGGLTLARLALLATWQGSLLVLGLGELALVAHAALTGGTGGASRMRAQAVSCLATAAGIAPLVAVSGTVVGGPFSAVELSWLHPVAYAVAAAVGAAWLGLEAWRPASGSLRRLLRAGALAAGLGVALLCLPGPREGLARALSWMSMADSFGASNLEQRALLSTARGGGRAFGESMFGAFVYAIPLVPLAFLALARRRRDPAPALFLAVWSAVTGLLALGQVRYGNDFAAVGALGFALLTAAAGRSIAKRLPAFASRPEPAAVMMAVAISALALWPGFSQGHANRARRSLDHLRGISLRDPVHSSFDISIHRFALAVGAATPPTQGFLDREASAEYAVLTPPRIGNAILQLARRPVPASNFGPYAGPERFTAAREFFALKGEAAALQRAAELDARFVVTSTAETARTGSIGHRLHADDGAARGGRPHLERFRLLTEGPAGGIAVGAQGATPGASIPYKLFERVAGAELVVAAAPGALVIASIDLRTPGGRRLPWTARGRAATDGVARLRVPYPSEPGASEPGASATVRAPGSALHTRAEGPYRVDVGNRRLEAHVSEAEVRDGRAVRVGAAVRPGASVGPEGDARP